MKKKIFFDSNIFIYAADKKSLFHNESVEIIKDSIETGFFTSDLCFLEFYQVITDGRKTPRPLSPAILQFSLQPISVFSQVSQID